MNGLRLRELLQGALHVWRVNGDVAVAGECCAIRASGRVVTVARVMEEGEPPYWEVALEGESGPPPQPCAGIHGMLRTVRDLLDPKSAAGRLVVGRVS